LGYRARPNLKKQQNKKKKKPSAKNKETKKTNQIFFLNPKNKQHTKL
jgi:hypothetical protein